MESITARELASKIDHTLVKPDATQDEIERLCMEGVEEGFASIVVNSAWLPFAEGVLAEMPEPVDRTEEGAEETRLSGLLARSSVPLCTVVSFPLGADSITAKSFAAEDAVRKGASEIDMVINLGYVKDGQWEELQEEIEMIRAGMEKFSPEAPVVLKTIIECPLLEEDEIIMASQRVVAGGADFVKTNTGYVGDGASIRYVQLIRQAIGDTAKIKASGGIRNYEQALTLLEAGADRLGTSAGMQIVKEARSRE